LIHPIAIAGIEPPELRRKGKTVATGDDIFFTITIYIRGTNRIHAGKLCPHRQGGDGKLALSIVESNNAGGIIKCLYGRIGKYLFAK
jgi:hypothetical protein